MTSSKKLLIDFRHLSTNFDLFEDFYLLISHSCSFPQTWQFRAGQSHATLDLFKILEFVIHTEASGLLYWMPRPPLLSIPTRLSGLRQSSSAHPFSEVVSTPFRLPPTVHNQIFNHATQHNFLLSRPSARNLWIHHSSLVAPQSPQPSSTWQSGHAAELLPKKEEF